jgi:hypothetical protein
MPASLSAVPESRRVLVDPLNQVVVRDEPLGALGDGVAVDEQDEFRDALDATALDQRRVVAGVDRGDDGVGGAGDVGENRLHTGTERAALGVQFQHDEVVAGEQVVEVALVGEFYWPVGVCRCGHVGLYAPRGCKPCVAVRGANLRERRADG